MRDQRVILGMIFGNLRGLIVSIENDPAAPVGDSTETRAGLSRRTIMKGAAWTVPALMVATSAPAYALSCVQGKWNALGRGKMLSGGLFNVDLDTLASVNGTIASAPTVVNETGYVHGPNAEGDPDVHANPLSVTALGLININATGLTTTVSTLLGLIASAPDGTGLLNQFGYALSSGLSKGASGYVDDNGTVRVAPAGGYPEVAALNLRQFLTPLLGGALTGVLANITDLTLHVGAMVGRAVLEQMCNTVVNPDGYKLHREYLVAYLKLVLTSPLLGNVVTAVTGLVPNLVVDTNAVWSLLNAVPVLQPLVTALQGVVPLTIQVTANAGTLATDLTSSPVPDGPNQPISVALGAGTATIDLAALLGSAFPGGASSMANSLPANSILFVDYPLPTTALSQFVADLQNTIISRIQDHVTVKIDAALLDPVFGTEITGVHISGSLAQLLNGTATATFKLLGGTLNLGAALAPLLVSIGNLVKGTIFAAGGPVQLALTAVNDLLAAVFDALKNVLNITLNVQNLPEKNNDPALPYKHTPGPARWNAGAQALPAGRYDVAALGLSAVSILASPDVLDLFLARGSVGPHSARP